MSFIFQFYVSPKLAGIVLGIVPPVAIAIVMYGRYLRSITKKTQDSLAQSTQVMLTSVLLYGVVISNIITRFQSQVKNVTVVLYFQIIGSGRENQQYTNSKGIWPRAERDTNVSRNKTINFPGSETQINEFLKLIFMQLKNFLVNVQLTINFSDSLELRNPLGIQI